MDNLISKKEIIELIDKLKQEIIEMPTAYISDKEIAKTPYYEGDGYADGQLIYDTWICPNCGADYEVGYNNHEYCPSCGQHIQHANWESEA